MNNIFKNILKEAKANINKNFIDCPCKTCVYSPIKTKDGWECCHPEGSGGYTHERFPKMLKNCSGYKDGLKYEN